MSGILYGLGLGPGDPELVTVKAARILRSATVIAYPVLENRDSFARMIAAEYIPDGIEEIPIIIPMTIERLPAQKAYDKATKKIAKVLCNGLDVVCLCEGDPFIYGSFMYLFARLSKLFKVDIIPGVTSLTACAAVAKKPLLARNEHLTIIPGPLSSLELRKRILEAETVVIMKVGRHLKRISTVLKELELEKKAIYVEHATLENEYVCRVSEAPDQAPYFSMIIVTKGNDPWL